MKLKFIKDAVYNGKLVFESGKIYDVEEKQGFAQRWLTRGVAVKHVEETVVLPKPKVEEKKPEAKKPEVVKAPEVKKPEVKKVEEVKIKAEDIL
jgi:hypothetical protein